MISKIEIEKLMAYIKSLEERANDQPGFQILITSQKARLREEQEKFWEVAAFAEHLPVIKWLHETGFDFNTPLSNKINYSYPKSSSYPISDAALLPVEIFEYVLNNTDKEILNNATVNVGKNFSLADYFIRCDNMEKLEKLLNKTDITTEKATSHLVLAIKTRRWDIATMFIKKGANVDYEVEGQSIRDLLNENKEFYINDALRRWGYEEEELGKTGNSRTGKISKADKEQADIRKSVAKAIMLANKGTRRL